MKPYTHAKSSSHKYGGIPEDYLDIHDFMDSSKGTFPDNRHRTLTHNSWFLSNVLEKVFGHIRKNNDGKEYSVRNIGEQHCIEDFGYIPSVQDYLTEMNMRDWMQGRAIKNNNDYPNSIKSVLQNDSNKKEITIMNWKD